QKVCFTIYIGRRASAADQTPELVRRASAGSRRRRCRGQVSRAAAGDQEDDRVLLLVGRGRTGRIAGPGWLNILPGVFVSWQAWTRSRVRLVSRGRLCRGFCPVDACLLRDLLCRTVGCGDEMAPPRTCSLLLERPSRVPDTPCPVMAARSGRVVAASPLGNGT